MLTTFTYTHILILSYYTQMSILRVICSKFKVVSINVLEQHQRFNYELLVQANMSGIFICVSVIIACSIFEI